MPKLEETSRAWGASLSGWPSLTTYTWFFKLRNGYTYIHVDGCQRGFCFYTLPTELFKALYIDNFPKYKLFLCMVFCCRLADFQLALLIKALNHM